MRASESAVAHRGLIAPFLPRRRACNWPAQATATLRMGLTVLAGLGIFLSERTATPCHRNFRHQSKAFLAATGVLARHLSISNGHRPSWASAQVKNQTAFGSGSCGKVGYAKRFSFDSRRHCGALAVRPRRLARPRRHAS